jgi:hypothetical protein
MLAFLLLVAVIGIAADVPKFNVQSSHIQRTVLPINDGSNALD